MPYYGDPAGKGGVGIGAKLQPTPVNYNDVLTFDAGYLFGFGADNRDHAIWVSAPLAPTTGPDPVNATLELAESSAGVYTLVGTPGGRVFDGVDCYDQAAGTPLALVGTDAWDKIGAVHRLRIEATNFPTDDCYYVIAVAENTNAPGGPLDLGDLVDIIVVFVRAQELSIFESISGGIDTATLNIALALAGHNMKMRNAAFIQGLPATKDLVGFERARDAVTTPTLEDPDSNEGIDGAIAQSVVTTPDSYWNIGVEKTGD